MQIPSLNGSEDSSQRKMAGCGLCTEDGCTRPAWSGGLCQRHYEAELKRRHAYQPPAPRSNGNGDYDVRFCSLFTNELELCGRPQYPAANGLTLLEACNYDRRLCAAIICTRPDSEQKTLLVSIPTGHQRRNVAAAVWKIREALGLEADFAREICQS